jgi:sulfide:quinone oxidoreductase
MSMRHKVTIAGGGIAALEATLALRALAGDVAIELLAPTTRSEYRPLAVLEPFALGEMPALDLARFAEEQGADHLRDTLVAVEPDAQTIVTGRGERVPYELLVVAAGAQAVEAVPGALTFRGHMDQRRVGLLVEDYVERRRGNLAFAVPEGQAWTLPAYELALMARATLEARGAAAVVVSLVTPEPAPLAMFGAQASGVVARLLDAAGIGVRTGALPLRMADGVLQFADGGEVPADDAIALPRLLGPGFAGLPADVHGFIPTDDHGQVAGLDDVYAAGDATAYPVKQGGLAAQQADAVAEAIAARLGAAIEPQPFRAVLRGLLMTGSNARYLEQGTGAGARPALWSPQSKVLGRYLLPYLGGTTGLAAEDDAADALAVEWVTPVS